MTSKEEAERQQRFNCANNPRAFRKQKCSDCKQKFICRSENKIYLENLNMKEIHGDI